MRVAVIIAVVGWIAIAFAADSLACSQCLCGTPIPPDALGGSVPARLRYGFEDRYLSKSNALDEEPGEEREREHRVAAFVLWRATPRLALLARAPYAVKRLTEAPLEAPVSTRTTRGIGDAEITALVGLVQQGGEHPSTLAAVLGATAPTGSNNREDATGARLDAHLQPGTGAWSGTAGLSFGVELGGGLLDANVLGRVNGKNEHGYRYGNGLLANAGYTRAARNGWQLLAQINGRSVARDRFEDGELSANTGGTVVYAAPGVRWLGVNGIGLEASVQIPVIEALDGDQDEHTTARVALSWGQ